ncbi:deaminase domain-containing protein [Paenibacillus azoreducens]|uniref:deaminase domain-containing protein n=1 Tax=Paenibacillus azoreducens TaxID=116718 RepID=UPI0039F5D8EE
MAKRKQVGVEELKNQQLAQGAKKEVRSIAQARAANEQLMDEIRGYCQQARELREQAVGLQRSGRTDFQVREEIQQLLNRADHLDAVADQKDGLPRQQALELIDRLEQEASDCRKLVQYNETVQARQEQELEDEKEAAAKMIQDAEKRLAQTRRVLAGKVAQLEKLEGQAEPPEKDKLFTTQKVNRENIVDDDGAWNRSKDTEFKILNEIASSLGDKTDAAVK